MLDDLNKLGLVTETPERQPLGDPSTQSADGSVEVVFRNIEHRLIREIRANRLVVGCVAWLTSGPILDALAGIEGVSIVVQKEDFLRPDLDVVRGDSWKHWLREKYDRLPQGPQRFEYEGTVLAGMSMLGDPTMDCVRCLGNHNAEKRAAMPRAHHKFLVFCDYVEATIEELPNGGESFKAGRVVPRKVWTGSYNLSANAGRSLENAVLLTDESCVGAYFAEWAQLFGLSEPLDWTSEYVQPDLRIGT